MAAVILHHDPSACRALESEVPALTIRPTLEQQDLPQVLIRWGSEKDGELDPKVNVVLNRAAALRNVPQARDVWAKSSLPMATAKSTWYRRYRYSLFDLQVVRVLRREIGQSRALEVSS